MTGAHPPLAPKLVEAGLNSWQAYPTVGVYTMGSSSGRVSTRTR
jgi:hypothetical protein